MKFMKPQFLALVPVAILILFTQVACNPAKQKDGAQIRARGVTATGGTINPTSSISTQGTITGFSPQAVAALVDPSVPVGNIQSVRFGGKIYLTQQGIDSSNFTVQIDLYDDKMAQYGNKPVNLNFQPQVGSQITGSVYGPGYPADITVFDMYGAIRFYGNISQDGSTFSGSVSMGTSPNSPSAPYQLGQFSVPVCGFFAC